MKLNFRRGFFRIWIAVAVLWVVPALIINAKDLGLTAQPETGPIVNTNEPTYERFEFQEPGGKTYWAVASDAYSAGIAIDEFVGLLKGGQDALHHRDAEGLEPNFVSPTNGARIWAMAGKATFVTGAPNGKMYTIEANTIQEAGAAANEMMTQSKPFPDVQADGSSGGPIFVSPTNAARIWSRRPRVGEVPDDGVTFDDVIPGNKTYVPPAPQLSPSEQQTALRSARNAALAIVFIPPLALLVLGVGLGWIVRGFSAKPLPRV